MAKKNNLLAQTASLLKDTGVLQGRMGIAAQNGEKPARKHKKDETVDLPANPESESSLDTTESLSAWLQTLKGSVAPEFVQVLQSQIQILGVVNSPTMSGMMIDNMTQCLASSLELAKDQKEKDDIRGAIIRTIQNFVFLSEAKLKYAIDTNKEEAKQLLDQAGNMISESISSIAAMAAPGMGVKAVKNVLGSVAQKSGIFASIGSWFVSKKVIEEKKEEFYKMLENLFDTLDKYPEYFGKSIVLNGMISKYRKVLIEWKSEEMMDAGKCKMSIATLNSLQSAADELSDAISSESTAKLIKASANAVTKIGANSLKRKAAKYDSKTFFTLLDVAEKDIASLKEEIAQENKRLERLKAEAKEIGALSFGKKKTAQAEIDDLTALISKRRETLNKAEAALNQTKYSYPELYSMKTKIYEYDSRLANIESKYMI